MDPQGVPVQPAQPAPTTRCWDWSSRWNACCRRRTRSVPAFESLLDSEDPWVRALARLQVGKMRIMLGQGGREAEAHLELALAEFRTLGERFGISLALSELADQLAMRGEFAGACEYYEQAIAVVTEVGAVEDVIRDADPTGPAVLAATAIGTPARPPSPRPSGAPKGSPGRTRWSSWRSPRRSSLAGAATPRRPAASSASRPPSWATTRSRRTSARRSTTCSATWPTISSEARTHRVAAWQAASEAGHASADRPGTRRGRGPGTAPRPVRAGGAAARGQRRRTRTAGSLPPGCGQDRAGRAASPRRSTVRRGDAGGYADELVSAGRGHARFVRVSLPRVE